MGDRYSKCEAESIVQEVKENDKAIRLSRVGATPYFRFNPYTNNDGVRIHRWDCISYHFERFAGESLLNYPHVVLPQNSDSWEVNSITDEWLVGQLMKHREGGIEIMPVDESPFAGGVISEWE